MKILEILLPNSVSDRSLSPQAVRQIGLLQKRMDAYVDKIMDPKTTTAGKEFLKLRLKDDYHELRGLLPSTHIVAEADVDTTQYEVFDHRTQRKVSGPYSTAKRARTARDKWDLKYGAARYGVRPATTPSLKEAVTKLPITPKDFELVKQIMERPIPAAIAPIYIQEIIEDDELNDQLATLEDSDPNRDVRPIIAEWFQRVMPDQMYRFTGNVASHQQKLGTLSPIHGYDPKHYKGTNDPITGNAYGRR
jgi:hypothetical protein